MIARHSLTPSVVLTVPVLTLCSLLSEGSEPAGYRKPPAGITEILNVPPPAQASVSPMRDRLLLLQGEHYPPLADLAAPYLRLAGLRINPATNGKQMEPHFAALTLVKIADGKRQELKTPPRPRLHEPQWSPDGKHFACANTSEGGVELWLGNAETRGFRKVAGLRINSAYAEQPVQWMPDGKTLLCLTVPPERGQPPRPPRSAAGPTIQESTGKKSPVRTFQDLLQNAHDEDLFEFYARCQVALVDSGTEKVTLVGRPDIIQSASPSPDGRYLLVVSNHRPYSYLLPAYAFPREVEVWDLAGKVVHKVASLPLADGVPIEGVPTGPRMVHWRPTAPSTLVWVEALDGGDPRKKAAERDRVVFHAAPFTAQPVEWLRLQQRFSDLKWGDKSGLALVTDYERERRWRRTMLCDAERPKEPGRLVWSLSAQDIYNSPGEVVLRTLPNGRRVFRVHDNALFLTGHGASPEGDRPYLDRMDLADFKCRRLFQCEDKSYEEVLGLLADDGSRMLTRRESAHEPPNFFVREADKDKRALTHFTDPVPQLRGVKQKLVTYKRADGVPLSFTLYLPPGHKEGERLPAVLWAYPREFVDAGTAGQVKGSPHRFTTFLGPTHLFFLTQGYAILDGATMPVVGPPETANNTYIEQIVSSAKAAIDKADDMGVIDRNRVGVGGHSYGAFMTMNLLAHSDHFRAGIARSGAYNRTLTPFGFQSERRTLWEAPEVYATMSPFNHAQKIKTPVLLIHGEADDNPGTFPMQSERMYHAIKGNGGVARYVTLPYESHRYLARETVEHTLYEMFAWFERYVKHPAERRPE